MEGRKEEGGIGDGVPIQGVVSAQVVLSLPQKYITPSEKEVEPMQRGPGGGIEGGWVKWRWRETEHLGCLFFCYFFRFGFFYFKSHGRSECRDDNGRCPRGLWRSSLARPHSPGPPLLKAAGILPFLFDPSHFPFPFHVVCCMVGRLLRDG